MDSNESADFLLESGIQSCKMTDEGKIEAGRIALAKAGSLGRFDAYLFLGKSFESSGNYARAAEAYAIGLSNRHRASAYRLAMLHGRRLLENSDRDFYLKTIRRFASEGHAPSRAQYFKERVKGSYGGYQFIVGLLSFLPNFVKTAIDAYRDPHGPKFQK